MTQEELNRRYFDWLYSIAVGDHFPRRSSYRMLLRYLHEVTFYYSIDLDGNRAADGEDLRYRFASENGYPDTMVAAYLDTRPCTVLEMMVALAIRCEEHILEDSAYGNRTHQWFRSMLNSLGVERMTDSNFDARKVGKIIHRFLDRDYERNGRGSLFTVQYPKRDMRTTEIWYQMCDWIEDGI